MCGSSTSSEALLSSIIPFAGSGLGYAMGFALKKVLKWMLIIVGFLATYSAATTDAMNYQVVTGSTGTSMKIAFIAVWGSNHVHSFPQMAFIVTVT
jgi:uncharacterized membrane protein (Fun14 family)